MIKFLPVLLCAAVAVHAAEIPLKWTSGNLKPAVNGRVYRFRSTENDASALRLSGKLIVPSKGVRVELEFKDDAQQSNRYPRLFVIGDFSLQLEATPASADKVAKVMLTDPKNPRRYIQIPVPAVHHPENWHHVVCTLEPRAKLMTLQFDRGEVKRHPLVFDLPTKPVPLLLGASRVNKSNRGYNGFIRNVSVTYPYDPDPVKGVKTVFDLEPPKVNGVPVRHFTVAAVPGRHLAFPGVAKLPGGDLAVVFREGAEHVCPYGRICMTISKDGGRNWSAPFAICDTETDERDPSIHVLPDGRIFVSLMAWNSWTRAKSTAEKFPQASEYVKQAGLPRSGYSQYMFSSDGGKTWTGRKIGDSNIFCPHGPACKGGYFYQPATGRDNGKRQIHMYRVSADATQVEKIGLVGETENGHGSIVPIYVEPHTAVLPDGTLVTAIRVDCDGHMRISFSKDDGRTWTKPEKTPLRGFPHHLLVLKDGRLLATYGYRYHPMGVRACISTDGGKTWDIEREMVIQNNGLNGDLGYPVSIELDDGEVLTVYYHITGKHPQCYIEGAIYRP